MSRECFGGDEDAVARRRRRERDHRSVESTRARFRRTCSCSARRLRGRTARYSRSPRGDITVYAGVGTVAESITVRSGGRSLSSVRDRAAFDVSTTSPPSRHREKAAHRIATSCTPTRRSGVERWISVSRVTPKIDQASVDVRGRVSMRSTRPHRAHAQVDPARDAARGRQTPPVRSRDRTRGRAPAPPTDCVDVQMSGVEPRILVRANRAASASHAKGNGVLAVRGCEGGDTLTRRAARVRAGGQGEN